MRPLLLIEDYAMSFDVQGAALFGQDVQPQSAHPGRCVELMGDPDKEHAVTLRHPQTKEDRLAAPSQKSAGLVMSDKLPPAAV